MNEYTARRSALLEKMEAGSMLLLYSGETVPCSLDEGYAFEANRNFFYLTGLRRENMALAMVKAGTEDLKDHIVLFIEEAVPSMERWTGKRVTKEEAIAITGIQDVRFIDSLDGFIGRCINREVVETLYMECYRDAKSDVDSYNMRKAKEMMAAYPTLALKNAFPVIAGMRMVKDESEIALMQKAVDLTGEALTRVLKTLKPGMMEYQAQAEFEYAIRMGGADGTAFATIAGSGINGCMLHYGTNHCEMKDGSLLLLDLGAKYKGYCADITRTYPVGGKYTERQKQIYDIVLAANRAVKEAAKPGMTTAELNDICKKKLAEGLIAIGKITSEEEIGTYYMHGVAHHLGIDTHDAVDPHTGKLAPGMVITNEPGLYIDEEEIGIRIEDDLLITEDGCIELSAHIARTTQEIEAIMAGIA
ncbi:MAG: aminopeptidase P N-terminal domain-containing protein [Clostridia bacterium]|nr:aminopeptidase P N-terminal domain-containing protein [Clostridia bacterium]